jgi:hypothetical protein
MRSWVTQVVLRCSVFALAALPQPPHTLAQERTAPPPHLSSEEWREDLHYLAQQMPLKHKQLFHTMTEAAFQEAVQRLDADIPQLNDDQIFVRLAQIMAMVQDGHTGFDTLPLPPPDSKDRIPIRFDRYDDGIYVRATAPEYADAVGGKVIKVGPYSWQEAIQRVDSIRPHDPGNEGERLAWSAKTQLNCPWVLHGLGLSNAADSADFLIEKNGKQRTFTMKASVPLGRWFFNSVPNDWIDARRAGAPVPLSQQHEDKPFWFSTLPAQHALYFQFNLVLQIGDETLDDFTKRLNVALASPQVDRLVIDMRNNTGGDNTLLRSLLVTLIRSKQNHRGGIYVITGPTTFSAAQNFVNRLGNYADVIFVGAPTAENVNFFGDTVGIILPHSHLLAAVSTLWWQDEDPRDKRTATFPELAVTGTFADYVEGRDPALEMALTTPTPLSMEAVLQAALPHGEQPMLAAYKQFVNDPIHRFLPDQEARINTLGYKLLSEKNFDGAVRIFEVNAHEHPNSANAYDSLGEGYADAGDTQHALQAYRRSVELNPGNSGAKQMILKLEEKK